MPMLDVRCCCEPLKLLGWLPAPDGVFAGDSQTFLLRHPVMPPPCIVPKDCITLQIAKWVTLFAEDDPTILALRKLSGDAAVKRISGGLAFKADGLSIDDLRNIVDFQEAK